MPADRGVSTVFTLNPTTATQLSLALADPDALVYLRIDNLDKRNWIAFAIGTENNASPGHHQVPPGSFYEFKWNFQGGSPLPEKPWGVRGDISAIAVSGNPMICFLGN